jgi:hypothetical protein
MRHVLRRWKYGVANSCTIIELGLGEIPSTLSGNSSMLHSSIMEVSPFHVIFYLNKIIISTCFEKGRYGKGASHILGLKYGLKEFLKKCLAHCTFIFGP